MTDRQPISSAPTDGTRVRVFHEEDAFASTSAIGMFVDGEWCCSEGFVLRNHRFVFTPTHWAPLDESDLS